MHHLIKSLLSLSIFCWCFLKTTHIIMILKAMNLIWFEHFIFVFSHIYKYIYIPWVRNRYKIHEIPLWLYAHLVNFIWLHTDLSIPYHHHGRYMVTICLIDSIKKCEKPSEMSILDPVWEILGFKFLMHIFISLKKFF